MNERIQQRPASATVHDPLRSLQQRALQAVADTPFVPQRYGTAFHITAPYPDVRNLPLNRFTATPTVPPLLDTLSAPDQERLLAFDSNDTYLAWHLAHADRLPIVLLHLNEGETREVALPPEAPDTSAVLWIVLEKGASLTLTELVEHSNFRMRRIKVIQHAESTFTYFNVRSSNLFSNEQIHVHLMGRDASAEVTHMVLGQGTEQADIAVRVYHEAPVTTSNVKVRTAVLSKATVMYRGLINVAREAHGTAGYQQGKALMLSPTAVADLLPELEINTNDVRCSHGVSTMHLDDAALFYLRSRGLGVQAARQLAIQGFFAQGLQLPTSIQTALAKAIDTLTIN
ncbi:MAG: SufD family Fe-S cluster assembly protein [Candidatus Andersenbacteria bacterium]